MPDRLTCNDCFTEISTGPQPDYKAFLSSAENCYADVSEYTTEIVLRRVKRTSSGWDGLQFWLFSWISSRCYANFRINDGLIPNIWRTAIVTLSLTLHNLWLTKCHKNLHVWPGCGDTDPYLCTSYCRVLPTGFWQTAYVMSFVYRLSQSVTRVYCDNATGSRITLRVGSQLLAW